MKSLMIKNIALGLLIAGCAASNAYALSGVSAKYIVGNAPVIKSLGGQDHSLTVSVSSDADGNNTVGGRAAKVNDYVVIEYTLHDEDGDSDPSGRVVKETFKAFYKSASGEWKEASLADSDIKFSNGKITFKITNEFAGATRIGFKVLEKTEFGLPYTNKWLKVADIWSTQAPGQVDTLDPTDPSKAPTDDTNGPNKDEIGSNPNDGPGEQKDPNKITSGPIESDDMRVYILAADSNDNYSIAGSTFVPKQGGKYRAVVWLDSNGNGALDSGEADLSANYNFTWELDGTYAGVGATTDSLAQNQNITLGQLNNDSMYSTTYKAGAQGYKLKVTATAK